MTKSVKKLMTISIVSIIVSIILFILWPLILQALANANQSGGETVVALSILSFINQATGIEIEGKLFTDFLRGLFASFPKIFDFSTINIYSIISLSLFILSVVLWVVWLIVVIARKKSPSVGAVIVALFTNTFAYLIIHSFLFMNYTDGNNAVNFTTYLLEIQKTMQATTSSTSSEVSITTSTLLRFAAEETTAATQLNFPVFILIFVFGSLGLAVLAYVLTFIEALVDMCTKRVSKHVEVSPLDEVVNKEDLTSVDELRKLLKEEVCPTPVNETKSEPAAQPQPSVVPAQNPAQPFIFQQFFGSATPVQQNIPTGPVQNAPAPSVEPAAPSLKEEDIRKIIHEEVAKSVNDAILKETLHGELPSGHANELHAIVKEEIDNSVSSLREEIRKIVREELDEVTVKALPAFESQPQIIKEIIRETPIIIKEEKKEEPVAEPAPQVEEKVEEPQPEVVPEPVVEEPAVVEEAPLEEVQVEEKPKIIRIPFTDRVRIMDPVMRNNFNELKSDIMAYGVKSRVSNSGDTFRLHTKTYVKITIAGKSLKLYFALNPEDYKDSTLPVFDAGHKGIYKDIPLVFKVKSDLSLRRAKQLIADAMAKDHLVQDQIVSKDWIQEIIDTYPESGKLQTAGLTDFGDEDEE